jgi:hypothetical protein
MIESLIPSSPQSNSVKESVRARYFEDQLRVSSMAPHAQCGHVKKLLKYISSLEKVRFQSFLQALIKSFFVQPYVAVALGYNCICHGPVGLVYACNGW